MGVTINVFLVAFNYIIAYLTDMVPAVSQLGIFSYLRQLNIPVI